MDNIYCIASPSWDSEYINLKIGRTQDIKKRISAYRTHNSEFDFLFGFPTKDKNTSTILEDCFFCYFYRGGNCNTEWRRISKDYYNKFKNIKDLKELSIFLNFELYRETMYILMKEGYSTYRSFMKKLKSLELKNL